MSLPVWLVLKEKLVPYLDQREFPHVQEHSDLQSRLGQHQARSDSINQLSPVIQSAQQMSSEPPGDKSAKGSGP